MTVCATRPAPLALAADGSYAARLVATAGLPSHPDGTARAVAPGWYPERWTLSGPEPYAVPLPGGQSEDPSSQVVPLTDGRVLISRRTPDGHHFALLYPSGPETGELLLGTLECERLVLLPPAPGGDRVYALAPEGSGTALWQVCGGAFGLELVTLVSGWCGGGAWLDQEGSLLALDRTDGQGRTRTVVIDVSLGGGQPSELLQIAEDSNDRLLLADPDSGLLLVRSDAPGEDRIGWGVLGSQRPVRFPDALHPEGVWVTPFAVQPGQILLPETCAVALRMTGPEADWIAVWRPQQRELQHLSAPADWLVETGLWTAAGELLLPCASDERPCALHRVTVPVPEPPPPRPRSPGIEPDGAGPGTGPASRPGSWLRPGAVASTEGSGAPAGPSRAASSDSALVVATPVPLQQAPLG